MDNLPYYYDYINANNSKISPSTVHCNNVGLNNFFTNYLLQRAISVFKWDGVPETWAENYFKYVLYCNGYFAVVNTDKYGVIPQACGLYGYNIFYQPTNAIISNPLLSGTLNPKIGSQFTLFRLQPNYSPINDIVAYYANMMALASECLGTNLVNSKLSYVFASKSKTQAETFKKLYDNIASGEPASFIDKTLFDENGNCNWKMFNQNLNANYITDKVLNDLRTIQNMYDTEIGIPNSNTSKKERMIVDEVNSNNFETQCLADTWLEELKKSCAQTNKMFGLSLKIDWRYDRNGNIINSRNVQLR